MPGVRGSGWPLLVLLVVLAMGFSACASGQDSAKPTTSIKPTTGASSPPAPAPKPAPAPPAVPAPPPPPGHGQTLVDYVKSNHIVEIAVHPGDPGAPTINLPLPKGWKDAGNRTPQWAYRAILFDPAVASDPPTIIALVSKLTGNVDPAKILEYAPDEIKNLPAYHGDDNATPSTLGGFNATQIAGSYTKNGQTRAIAQKTVVIPGGSALYVLQLNAEGANDQQQRLEYATGVVDKQTTITH
jgi:hypothetical protein